MQTYCMNLLTLHLCVEAEWKLCLENLSKAQAHHTSQVCPIMLQRKSKDKSLYMLQRLLQKQHYQTQMLSCTSLLHPCVENAKPCSTAQRLPTVRWRMMMHLPSLRRERQGLGKWRTTCCRRTGLKTSKEPEGE